MATGQVLITRIMMEEVSQFVFSYSITGEFWIAFLLLCGAFSKAVVADSPTYWRLNNREIGTDYHRKCAWLELLKETADSSDDRYMTKCIYDGVENPSTFLSTGTRLVALIYLLSTFSPGLCGLTVTLIFVQHHDEHITVVEGRITATLDGKDMIVKAGDPPLIIPRLHLHGFHGFPGESCVFEERNLPPGDYKVL
jgi:mannose-6-phosphate isomerase-like protein (cupin superfamily)